MTRSVKIPGPDHPIAIAPYGARVRVLWKGEVVAQTTRALRLTEASWPPVFYIPRADVRADLLRASATTTWCPYKGQASYHGLEWGQARSADAIWVYETPHEGVAAIAGHLAFYPNRVDRIEVGPG